MKQYIVYIAVCLFLFTSCQETVDMPIYETPVAATGIGKKIVESGYVAILHEESVTSPVAGVTECYFNLLASDGYLAKLYLYEVDLNLSDIDIVVCNANNSNSTSSFSTQLLSEQVKLVDSENNKILGAVNGGSFASSNSKPYGILIKNGTVLKSTATLTGNNANPVFFAVTKTKIALIGNFNEIGTTVSLTELNNAVGGKAWLLRDSSIISLSTDSKQARTVVGVTANNKVYFMVVDAGQYFISTGITGYNAAKIMLYLGAKNAILLNEGNSTTFISRDITGLYVKNTPQNLGVEAKVNNGLIIVQK